MPVKKKLDKNILVVSKGVFNIKEVLSTIKSELKTQELDFFEKEQAIKDNQYGKQIGVQFSAEYEYDEIAKTEFTITAKFKDVQKVKVEGKTLDTGDIEIIFLGEVIYDYKYNWYTNKFNEFLFGVYLKYFKDKEFEKKYLIPSQKKLDSIYLAVKNLLDFYK